MTTETIEKTQDSQTAKTDAASNGAVEISNDFDKKIDSDEKAVETEPVSDKDEKLSDTNDNGDDDTAEDADDVAGDDNEKSVISDELIGRAVNAGLEKSEAQSFKSQEDLERTLALLEKNRPTTAEDKDTSGDKTKTDKAKPFEVKLDEELYDPEIVQTVKGMNEHYASAIESLQSQLAQTQAELKGLREIASSQEVQAFERQFDSMIDALDDEYSEFLGKGPGSKLNVSSPQFKNREKIIEEMSDFVAGRQARGKTVPSQHEVFNRALKIVFSDKFESLAAKKTRSAVKKRNSQIIENSTGGKGKTLTAEEEAVKISTDFDKKIDSEGF